VGTEQQEGPEAYVLSLLAEGKHEAAFELVAEFGSPGCYAPHFAALGQRLWRSGRCQEAQAILRQALELDPERAATWLALACALLSDEQLAEGDRCLVEALLRDGALAPAHYLRGVVAARSGRLSEAADHFITCLEVEPTHRAAAGELRQLIAPLAISDPLLSRAEVALRRAPTPGKGPRRATLSVCLITRNEADSLPRCLESVQALADQIVVVDTGSTDETVQIARQFGAEVHHFPWRDDFAAARNAAISHATCDWVLIMDADEELPAESSAQLDGLLAHPIPGPVCQLITHTPTHGASRYGIDLVGHLRLFRNGAGIHFRSAIHEQLVDQQGRLIDSAVATGILVHHHGYLESPEAMAERGERNLRMIAAQLEADPRNAYLLFHLGHACLAGGRAEEAVAALSRAVELAEPGHAFCTKAVVLLAHGLDLLQRGAEAEPIVRAALAGQPEHPELLCALGHLLERQHRVEEAVEVYRAAARGRFGPNTDYHDFACRDATPRGRLAALRLARGEGEEALSEVEAALRIRPQMAELRRLRAAALISLGRYAEAYAELESRLREDPKDGLAHNTLGVALAVQGRHRAALREFKLALALHPDDVDILCNLASAQQALGDPAAARDTFEKALQLRPGHAPAWLGVAKSYLEAGAYQASARCYQMAAQVSGRAPEVMAEVASARDRLAALARAGARAAQDRAQAGPRSAPSQESL